MTAKTFQYTKAFERNIGWLTSQEQEKLRTSRVGIAGLGGAGGFQAQALARLGVGKFKIADPDVFGTKSHGSAYPFNPWRACRSF